MVKVIDRCVIVARKTQLQELMLRHNTREQAKFYLQAQGSDFSVIAKRHENYTAALDALKRSIPGHLKLVVIDRSFLPQFEFLDDVVITIGQDGLVSNTAKYLSGQPLIGINPEPDFIEGILLPWRVESVEKLIFKIIAGKQNAQWVTLAEATLNDGRQLRAFNDLFIGQAGHSSALYDISFAGQNEFQSSSGIIISTGAGSTGWMSSVSTGALRYVANQHVPFIELEAPTSTGFPRDADALSFAVREPWPSRTTGTDLVTGQISNQSKLVVHSRMAANGVIFSDGIEWDFLEFNAGTIATISVASEKVKLVVP